MTIDKWREDAINWIYQTSELPEVSPTKYYFGIPGALRRHRCETPYHLAKPSLQARANALHIISRHVPTDFVPVELGITPNRGIELDWRKGEKELEIEVLPDGSIEILRYLAGTTINETKMQEPDWRLAEAFVWLKRS
jgi:hypothetical protein